MYIVFEGIVGCGKSTQSKLLVQYLKEKFVNKNVVLTREPGGSRISDSIRTIAQGMKFDEEMDFVCEAYLYAASRAQTLRRVVSPVIKEGGIVVADRSVFSSVAFQGAGRGLGEKKILKINEVAVGDTWPDLVILVDLPVELGIKRAFDLNGDKFEGMEKPFWEKVRAGYLKMAKRHKECRLVNGEGSVEEVFERIKKEVTHFLS